MISGFDFTTPLPIADAVRRTTRAIRSPKCRSQTFQVRGGVLYPDTGGPGPRGSGSTPTSCRARASRGSRSRRRPCAAATGCSTTCSARTASAPTRPAIPARTALTPSLDNGQTFVATLANPFPNGLLEPVGSGLGLMTNVGLGVSFPYVGEVRTPRTHRWSIGVQRELPWLVPGRGHLRRARYSREHSGLPRAELGARAVLLDVAGARRRDQQLPDAAGAESVRRAAAGHQHQRRQRRALAAAASVSAVHAASSGRSRRSARPTTRRSRDGSSGAWRTGSPCRWPTRGRRR